METDCPSPRGNLRRGLVVQELTSASIHRDTAPGPQQHDVGIIGINPGRVVSSPRAHPDGGKFLPPSVIYKWSMLRRSCPDPSDAPESTQIRVAAATVPLRSHRKLSLRRRSGRRRRITHIHCAIHAIRVRGAMAILMRQGFAGILVSSRQFSPSLRIYTTRCPGLRSSSHRPWRPPRRHSDA